MSSAGAGDAVGGGVELLVLSLLEGVQVGGGGGGGGGGVIGSLPQPSHSDVQKNVNRSRLVVLSPHF